MRRAERIVVVGGGAVGWAAVAAYRRAGGRGNVLLVAEADEPGDGAELVLDRAVALDADAGWVEISESVRLDYDRCLLAGGGVELASSAGLLLTPDGAAVATDAALRTTGDRVLAARDEREAARAGARLAGT